MIYIENNSPGRETKNKIQKRIVYYNIYLQKDYIIVIIL